MCEAAACERENGTTGGPARGAHVIPSMSIIIIIIIIIMFMFMFMFTCICMFMFIIMNSMHNDNNHHHNHNDNHLYNNGYRKLSRHGGHPPTARI